MSQCTKYHDTVREELGEMLDRLSSVYRRSNPQDVLLYTYSGVTSTGQDVAKATSSLFSQTVREIKYEIYLYNTVTGNRKVAELDTKAQTGLIKVGYKQGKKELKFRMRVGFGGRVSDYELEDKGQYLSHFTKDMIADNLESLVSQI